MRSSRRSTTWAGTSRQAPNNLRWIAIITLVLITVMNIFGVRLVAIVNNTGVLFEILGMVVFAFIVALFHHHQSAGVIFHTGGTSLTTGTFLVAMFMSLYVIYGFDTASTLAEETKNPRREAPKAVIASVIGAFVDRRRSSSTRCCSAIPDMKTAIKEGWGPAQIIDANFGNAFSTVFLLVVAAAIFVCCLAILTSTIRLCFGMARDDTLPGSRYLSKVNPELHTPVWSCIVIGLLAGIPFIQFTGVAIIAIAATGMIYLSYLIGNLALFRARLRGWPRAEGAVLARAVGHAAQRPRAPLRRRDAREHRVAARRDEPAADPRGAGARLPLALAEPPAGAVVDALRDRDRRRRLLPARAADEARPPAGARGERSARGGGGPTT